MRSISMIVLLAAVAGCQTPDQALKDAIQFNHPEDIAAAVKDGASPANTPALNFAVTQKRIDLARMLIERGAVVNYEYNGETPLYLAVKNEDANMVRLLLEHEANPDKPVANTTPYKLALEQGNIPVISLMVQAKRKRDAAMSKAMGKPAAHVEATQSQRLVLMPLRVAAEDQNLQPAMETALVEGLQDKYEVFAGERVRQKANEIFRKESRAAKHDCDETRCMQDIAMAFQTELVATANITKQGGNYFLALSIQNVMDEKAVYTKSLPCEQCSASQVVEKLKELSE